MRVNHTEVCLKWPGAGQINKIPCLLKGKEKCSVSHGLFYYVPGTNISKSKGRLCFCAACISCH